MWFKEKEENSVLNKKDPKQEHVYKNEVNALIYIVIFGRVNIF